MACLTETTRPSKRLPSTSASANVTFGVISYLRTIGLDRFTGSVQVSQVPEQQCLCVTIRFRRVQSLPAIISRVRRPFDLGADIETIDAHLSWTRSCAAGGSMSRLTPFWVSR